MNMELLSAGL